VLHAYEDEVSADADTHANLDVPSTVPVQASRAEQLYGPIYDWEIRILALSPGRLGEPLEAKIHLAAFTHDSGVVLHDARIKTNYEALSYCWGQPIFDRSILCNSVDYPITQGLYQALQRLRLQDKVRYLWVDQLCINQHNLSERSVQVQKMLLIYQTVRRVLVWLGEAGLHTGAAIYTTVDLCKRMPNEEVGLTSDLHTLQLCSRHFENFVRGLRDLLSRP
jgi:hypothetical protein